MVEELRLPEVCIFGTLQKNLATIRALDPGDDDPRRSGLAAKRSTKALPLLNRKGYQRICFTHTPSASLTWRHGICGRYE